MAKSTRVGAALAAMFLSGLVMAQEPPSVASRLAASKLAATAGKLADAEQELRAALVQATAAERVQITQELAALLVRQGRTDEATALAGAPPQGLAKGEDPILRLIAVLDSGAGTNEADAVRDAAAQLNTLGALVVPHLLAAMPRLGPFGINNVLDLLVRYDDPHITAALSAMLDTADAGVVTAIANRLDDMRHGVSLPLAQRIAQAKVEPKAQAQALLVLLQHESTAAATQQLAQRLAEDPAAEVQRMLGQALASVQEPWVVDVLAAQMRHSSAERRAAATFEWIKRQPKLTEDQALAAIQALPPQKVAWVSNSLGSVHPDWVRVGLLSLRALPQAEAWSGNAQQFVGRWEWWRMPDESGPELLAARFPERPQHEPSASQAVGNEINELIARGWMLPASLDARLAEVAGPSGYWHVVVKALPDNAEDRAIAVWEKASDPYDFVRAAVQAERPWHRLVVRHLLLATRSDQVETLFLQRDWSGAPPEVATALAELAARWPESPSGGQLQWHAPLIAAFHRHANLPPSVILPLVAAGNAKAWQTLVERDPQAALEQARGAAKLHSFQISDVGKLLGGRGGPSDMPFALRVRSMFEGSGQHGYSELVRFFVEHGAGHLDLIRLAVVPVPPGPLQESRVQIASFAAKGARVQDLEELLGLMPSLQPRCWNALVEALSPPAFVAQVAPWVAAVEACLARPWTRIENESMMRGVASADQLLWLVWRLGDSQDPSALPVLRRVMALVKDDAKFLDRAALAALQCAGPTRRQLLLELLASPRLEIVRPALEALEQRTDGELRARTQEAVLRLGETLDNVTAVFGALDKPDRIALALAILDGDRFERFTQDLCIAALTTIGQAKDARYLPQLARGARHPRSGVRSSAASAIGNTFALEAAPYLLELLKDDNEPVRKTAQKCLDDLANYLDARAKWEARLK